MSPILLSISTESTRAKYIYTEYPPKSIGLDLKDERLARGDGRRRRERNYRRWRRFRGG